MNTIEKVLEDNPKTVKSALSGRKSALIFLIGQAIRQVKNHHLPTTGNERKKEKRCQ